ncbi:6,7-dimethyl-8-ribityllumazine synthase 2 [compost metagenome]|jgi:6,7-dimethyl-8-ribityllumazine synthase|uniref:6,7-dimethyl-8-ribityllumazine synthase n=1 Tax=Pseudomonas sp. BF-B-30 TaxID=2832388 RepID=UPI000FA48F68|nr:6,7-dimethyl-8-ribityllumazine synthase [Pseudomonas sp. BF-B-30]
MRIDKYAFIKVGEQDEFVERTFKGFCEVIPQSQVDTFLIADPFSVPTLARDLAKTGYYHAIVVSMMILEDINFRQDHIADAVTSGLVRVGLDTDSLVLPIVLLPRNGQEATWQHDDFCDYFLAKGRATASAALKDSKLMSSLPFPKNVVGWLWPM